MIQCKLYAHGSGGGGGQEREVADGADVVSTDTVCETRNCERVICETGCEMRCD